MINLHQIRTFLAIAERESLTKAAEDLNISQPTASVHLHALETYYGAKLFVYSGHRLNLTDPGRVLYRYAKKLLALEVEAKRSVEAFIHLECGKISLGASSNIGVYVLPKLLAKFEAMHPKIEMKVFIGVTRAVEEKLLAREIDLGIVEAQVSSTDLVVEPWLEDNLVVIVPPQHPWALLKEVTADQLVLESFVVGEPGSGTRRVMKAQMGDLVEKIRVVLEVGSTEAVKRTVEAGLGISVVGESCVVRERQLKTLSVLSIAGLSLRKEFSIVYVKDVPRSPAPEEFLRFLKSERPSLEL